MNLDWTDTQLRIAAVVALWAVALLGGLFIHRRWKARKESRRRMYAEDDALAEARVADDMEQQNFLSRWLYLAGFRRRGATTTFIAATLLMLALGMACALAADSSGIAREAAFAAGGVPGGIGDLAKPILLAGPWIVAVMFALLPWSLVNSARKRRVADVESDMPVTLELLATMSESGLGFDSALTRVCESRRDERPLFEELKTFQLEILGGISRVQCFRRLSRRLEVPSMTIFVSALVQAEQVGAGFSNVLRIQADDLRNRRREDANMLAQALPVKLIFPLVTCFLPGIFVCTLGPIFLQFIKLADSVTRAR
jgi:tight adherence protein C